jgi:hypothetical protein
VFFGKPGQLLFQGRQSVSKIMSINQDGTGEALASSVDIMQLQNVSPDGRWALVGVTPERGHGDTNVIIGAAKSASYRIRQHIYHRLLEVSHRLAVPP